MSGGVHPHMCFSISGRKWVEGALSNENEHGMARCLSAGWDERVPTLASIYMTVTGPESGRLKIKLGEMVG